MRQSVFAGKIPLSADEEAGTGSPDDLGQEAKPDRLHEACGVFGLYAPGEDVARVTYFGLYALQHRGQESAGIASSDGTYSLSPPADGTGFPGIYRGGSSSSFQAIALLAILATRLRAPAGLRMPSRLS